MNCRNCKFLDLIDSRISPGGIMGVHTYRCENKESPSFGNKMNNITNLALGSNIDARLKNSCEKFEAKQ